MREVAGATGRSKSWVQRHVTLYRSGGDESLVPRPRGPKSTPNQTPAIVEDAIVALRKQVGELGLDAGARTHRLPPRPSGPRRARLGGPGGGDRPEVVRIFFDVPATYGLPQSVLSDNGAVFISTVTLCQTLSCCWCDLLFSSPAGNAFPCGQRPD